MGIREPIASWIALPACARADWIVDGIPIRLVKVCVAFPACIPHVSGVPSNQCIRLGCIIQSEKRTTRLQDSSLGKGKEKPRIRREYRDGVGV